MKMDDRNHNPKNGLLCLDVTFFTSGASSNAIKQDEESYYIEYDGRRYHFKLLSETNYISSQEEKELLLSYHKRIKESLFGSLRILYSDLIESPKYYFGNTSAQKISPLIEYTKDDKEFIIDYDDNIIMLKEDYLDLFCLDYPNIREVSDLEIYGMFLVYKSLPPEKNINEFLDKYKEMYGVDIISNVK